MAIEQGNAGVRVRQLGPEAAGAFIAVAFKPLPCPLVFTAGLQMQTGAAVFPCVGLMLWSRCPGPLPSCGPNSLKSSRLSLDPDPPICLMKSHTQVSWLLPPPVGSLPRLPAPGLGENVSILSWVDLSRKRGQGRLAMESQETGLLALCQLGLHMEGMLNWPSLPPEK